MTTQVIPPYAQFFGTDGEPLDGGAVYVGVAGLDPEANPQDCFSDAGLTTALSQPVATTTGYPAVLGSPVGIFCANNYSITVRDGAGVLVYSNLNVRGLQTIDTGIFQTADDVLTSIAGLSVDANKGFYGNGVDSVALYDLTSYGRTLGGLPSAAALRTNISVYTQAEVDAAVAVATNRQVAAAICDGATTPALTAARNLSVARSSTGTFDYTFNAAEADANYLVIATADYNTVPRTCMWENKTTTGFTVRLRNTSNAAVDWPHDVVVMRP